MNNKKSSRQFKRVVMSGQIQALLPSAMGKALLLVSPKGTVEYCDHMAKSLFGYSDEEFIGLNVQHLFSSQLRQTHIDKRTQYLKKPAATEFGLDKTVIGQRYNGDTFQMSVYLEPLLIDDQSVIYVLITPLSPVYNWLPVDSGRDQSKITQADNSSCPMLSIDKRLLDRQCDGWWLIDIEKQTVFYSERFRALTEVPESSSDHNGILGPNTLVEGNKLSGFDLLSMFNRLKAPVIKVLRYGEGKNAKLTLAHISTLKSDEGGIRGILATHLNISGVYRQSISSFYLPNSPYLTEALVSGSSRQIQSLATVIQKVIIKLLEAVDCTYAELVFISTRGDVFKSQQYGKSIVVPEHSGLEMAVFVNQKPKQWAVNSLGNKYQVLCVPFLYGEKVRSAINLYQRREREYASDFVLSMVIWAFHLARQLAEKKHYIDDIGFFSEVNENQIPTRLMEQAAE